MPWCVSCFVSLTHVICILHLLLANHGTQSDICGEEVTCRGNRPILSTGCCPVEAGQVCRPTNGTLCDAELGFYCKNEEGIYVTNGQGTCKGEFDLHVVSRGETIVDLAWRHSDQTQHSLEYILLFRADSNHQDSREWRHVEIGDASSYSVQKLMPSTLYFFKVAVWQNTQLDSFGNVSETIMVETRPVEFCKYRGDLYLVGQPFVHDCEDNCTCMATGEFRCLPLCPDRGVPELAEGCWVEEGEGCCEYKVSCPVGGEPCHHNGTVYNHGDKFEDNCRLCVCSHGQVKCTVAEDCQDEGCEYENKTYNLMELFTSSRCGLCRCDAHGEVDCGPECSPVELVLPDISCPDPHVRQDGCCDTLHCFDPNLSKVQRVRRMFALSYSPVTLTLSFEVDPKTEVNGVPLYCEYEILYSNTSSPYVTWHRRRVQPIDVRLHDDQAFEQIEPAEALTKDNAIVVGDRAYVTLSGMYPNTTYYVKIIALDRSRQDAGEVEEGQIETPAAVETEGEAVSAMVVVKTKPLENATSCFHEGKELLHGEEATDKCHSTCRCDLGRVTCQSNCESESGVLATSLACPKPVLERQHEHQCCPEWRCEPTTGGCLHEGLMLAPGQSIVDGCQRCSCNSSTIHCSSVCPPSGEPPRENCVLQELEGQCCPVWMCSKEVHQPYGVKASMTLLIYGKCMSRDPRSLDVVKEKVMQRVKKLCVDYLESQSKAASTMCSNIQQELRCRAETETQERTRLKRETFFLPPSENEIMAQFYIQRNFSSSGPKEETISRVQEAAALLYSLLNKVYRIHLSETDVLVMSGSLEQTYMGYACARGFQFQSGQCVLSVVESFPSFQQEVDQLEVSDISDSSATLTWSLLDQNIAQKVVGLEIQHRIRGEVQWKTIAQISVRRTSFRATSLSAQTLYDIRLVAVTRWAGQNKWPMAHAQFSTLSISESTMAGQAALALDKAIVSDTFVILFWDPLPSHLASQIAEAAISYKNARSANYSFSETIPTPLHSHFKLAELDPDITYTAKITVTLKSGTTITSPAIHFVTGSERLCMSTQLVVSVIVVCIVAVIVAVIVVTMCVMWRKGLRNSTGSEFVNKTYGITFDAGNNDIVLAANPSSDGGKFG